MQVVSGPIGRERVHYEAPTPRAVRDEMRAFLDWFNGKRQLDPVLKAGIAHLWFVTIHPFEDGNGRIARAIADLGAGAFGAEPSALLQHVRADPAGAERLLRHSGERRRRATSTSRLGWSGSWAVSAAPSTARRRSSTPSCRRRDSGRRMPAQPSTSASA